MSGERLAWLHIMSHKGKDFEWDATMSESHPFGIEGVDYAACYAIRSERLVRESALTDAEKARKKAVQQLAETNRQLECGLSIGGRQFYGTREDIGWLQSHELELRMHRLTAQAGRNHLRGEYDALLAKASELADRWERIGNEHGLRQFTGNDHLLFANELRVRLLAEGGDGG